MAEFTVGGQSYRSGKIPALTQLHVARRLAPILGALKDAVFAVKGTDETADPAASVAAMLAPIATAVARMSDEDATYVIATCLGVCSRKQDGAWTAVWAKGATSPMFDDIGMVEMLHISVEVIKDQLGPFSLGLTSG